MTDPRLAAFHQLAVDTYAAQHAAPDSPRIQVAFALLGLHWTLDRGLTGTQVRGAHKRLADETKDWPAFDRPSHPAGVTVFDVAAATTPEEHEERLHGWARAVWSAWAPAHTAVHALTDRYWPLIARR